MLPKVDFYLFPDFSLHREKLNHKGITSSDQLCLRLIEDTGVVLLPATAFGFQDDFLAARLAYVDFVPPEKDVKFSVEINAPKVRQGIEAISTLDKASVIEFINPLQNES